MGSMIEQVEKNNHAGGEGDECKPYNSDGAYYPA